MSPLPFVRTASALACVLALGACSSPTLPEDWGLDAVPAVHTVSGPDGWHASAIRTVSNDPDVPYPATDGHHFMDSSATYRVGVAIPDSLRPAPWWAIGRTPREHWLGGHAANFPLSSESRRVPVADVAVPAHFQGQIGAAFVVTSDVTDTVGTTLFGCDGDRCYLVAADGPADGSERAQNAYADLLSTVRIES